MLFVSCNKIVWSVFFAILTLYHLAFGFKELFFFIIIIIYLINLIFFWPNGF